MPERMYAKDLWGRKFTSISGDLARERNWSAIRAHPALVLWGQARVQASVVRGTQPNARVPTIEDNGFVLWESAAINLYLAEKYGSPLFPVTPEAKGRMLQWAFYIANDVEPPLITVLRNRVVFPPEQRDPTLADEAENILRSKFVILEQQLISAPYFGGEHWNMSD